MGGGDRARDYNEKLKSEIEARIEAERRMLGRRRQDVEDCACKAGMFPTAGRRGVLFAAGSALLAGMGAPLSGARAAAQKAPAGRHVALYWDFDSTVRLEVGVELLGAFAEEGDIVRSATPSGLVASATHFGPYGGLRAAHDAVHEWCTSNNQRVAGPSWEIYGHWLDEWNGDPSRIRTDVFYLLR